MFLILVYLRIRKSLYFIKKKVFSSVLVLHFWRQPSHILTPLLINKRSNHPSVSFSHDYHRQSEREREGVSETKLANTTRVKEEAYVVIPPPKRNQSRLMCFIFLGGGALAWPESCGWNGWLKIALSNKYLLFLTIKEIRIWLKRHLASKSKMKNKIGTISFNSHHCPEFKATSLRKLTEIISSEKCFIIFI